MNLQKFGELVTEAIPLDQSKEGVMCFGFCNYTHNHLHEHIRDCFRKTGRLPEADYCFGVLVYHVWSDILKKPILIHTVEHDSKTINKMILKGLC